jgi:methyl-accepting chemotaxis protein
MTYVTVLILAGIVALLVMGWEILGTIRHISRQIGSRLSQIEASICRVNDKFQKIVADITELKGSDKQVKESLAEIRDSALDMKSELEQIALDVSEIKSSAESYDDERL